MSGYAAAGYAVLNICSSVSIVLVNKRVFGGGFQFPMTLTFFHFCFTVIWYKLLALAGVYTPCASDAVPNSERFKVAGAVFSSIGFMNLSLNANSIGFYQVTKLVIVPVTLVINAVAYGIYSTTKVMIALAILLAGVGVATVTEVHLRPLGLFYGVVAVLATAVCQIWQGSKQKEFGVSATQLQAALAPWMSAQSLAAALFTEILNGDDSSYSFFREAVSGDEAKRLTMWLVLGTCFIALLVNLSSFGLIGKTSAVTFQVVGHAKTCLVLAGGYLLFPAHGEHQQEQLYHNIMGVSIAMLGVVLYGHLKHASGQQAPDCFDVLCPGCVLTLIEPKVEETGEPLMTRS